MSPEMEMCGDPDKEGYLVIDLNKPGELDMAFVDDKIDRITLQLPGDGHDSSSGEGRVNYVIANNIMYVFGYSKSILEIKDRNELKRVNTEFQSMGTLKCYYRSRTLPENEI